MCVKARGFKLYMTCKVYLHGSATIEVSVFCVATNSPLGDFSFSSNFLNNHKITVFEKDSRWLYKIIFQSFNRSHVVHINTYLHTYAPKMKTLQRIDFIIIIIL